MEENKMKELIFAIYSAVAFVLGKFGVDNTDNEFAWVDFVMKKLFG